MSRSLIRKTQLHPDVVDLFGDSSKKIDLFTALDNQPPATLFAAADKRNSISVLDFADTSTQHAIFVSFLPEITNLTLGLRITLHWAAATATSGNVVWVAGFESMTGSISIDAFNTTSTVTVATNSTNGVLNKTELVLNTINATALGNGYRLRVSRQGGNILDTMVGLAELVLVQVESEV